MNIYWQGHRFQDDIEHGNSQSAADWLIKVITLLFADDVELSRVGLYTATSDAAVDVSVDFWRQAIKEGVDLVNPRDFPWTLASAMAAHAATETGIQGPCLTLVGGSEAGIAVLSHGINDLKKGIVDLALVAGIDPNGADLTPKKSPAAVIALTSKNTTLMARIEPGTNDKAKMIISPYASEPLFQLCRARENHREIKITAPYESAYQVVHCD